MGNSFPQDAESAIGKHFQVNGRSFHITRKLGEGGYAYVFEVVSDLSGKKYAMKRILAQDRATIELAEKEIAIMKQCQHPNIVQYKGCSKISHSKRDNRKTCSEYFVLMEYCGGGTLNEHLDHLSRSLSETEVLNIFLDIVRAVEMLHSWDPPVCHRDIKLENVLLAVDHHWKLCDFGSCTTRSRAYTTKEEISREEERIQMFTTSCYRAPEMVDLWRRQVVGTKADIWALGCILYAVAFRKHPFQDGSALHIANSSVRMPKRTGFSKGFMKLLKSLFSIDPEKRPTAEEVAKKVNLLLSGDDHSTDFSHAHSSKRSHRFAKELRQPESEDELAAEDNRKARHRRKKEVKRRHEKNRHKRHQSQFSQDSTEESSSGDDRCSQKFQESRRRGDIEAMQGKSPTDDGNGRLASAKEKKNSKKTVATMHSTDTFASGIEPISFSAGMDSNAAFPASEDNWVAFGCSPAGQSDVSSSLASSRAKSNTSHWANPTPSQQDYSSLFASMAVSNCSNGSPTSRFLEQSTARAPPEYLAASASPHQGSFEFASSHQIAHEQYPPVCCGQSPSPGRSELPYEIEEFQQGPASDPSAMNPYDPMRFPQFYNPSAAAGVNDAPQRSSAHNNAVPKDNNWIEF